MKQYIGSKTISAEPMTQHEFFKTRRNFNAENIDKDREGYLVKYSDGYESWSPKDVFEEAYSELVVGPNATEETLLKVSVFPSKILSIGVAPDPDYGGAHQYQFQNSIGFKDGQAGYDKSFQKIQFVQKNIDGTMKPGLQTEQLLLAIIDRHVKLNNKFPSEDGLKFIRKIEESLVHLEDRVRERMNRGVMGDLKK
jgi:hypothetical protein